MHVLPTPGASRGQKGKQASGSWGPEVLLEEKIWRKSVHTEEPTQRRVQSPSSSIPGIQLRSHLNRILACAGPVQICPSSQTHWLSKPVLDYKVGAFFFIFNFLHLNLFLWNMHTKTSRHSKVLKECTFLFCCFRMIRNIWLNCLLA